MFRRYLILLIPTMIALTGCRIVSGATGGVTAEAAETQGVIVEGIPSLTVNHFSGTINVMNGEPGRIAADLTKQSRLPDDAEAQAQLEQIVMSFTQTGTDVTLTVQGPDGVGELATGPSAELELRVPPGTTLDLNLGAGEITVEEPAGDVTVNNGAGEATVSLPADASFHLIVTGGVAEIDSEFEGVPSGGVAANVDTVVGGNPTQTLTFNVGAGEVHLREAP